MHYSELIVPAVIIVWAGFEYHRREQDHNERMAFLQRGLMPPDSSLDPPAWRLWTTSAIAFLLFLLIIGMIMLGFKTIAPYGAPFFFIALPFVPIFVVLLLILRRDYQTAKDLSSGNRKTS